MNLAFVFVLCVSCTMNSLVIKVERKTEIKNCMWKNYQGLALFVDAREEHYTRTDINATYF